jgi:hypothetical protein
MSAWSSSTYGVSPPPLGGSKHSAVTSATRESRFERLKILKPRALPGDSYPARLVSIIGRIVGTRNVHSRGPGRGADGGSEGLGTG